jgi:hypothetical protein
MKLPDAAISPESSGEYPVAAAERDAWILSRRPQRNAVDPWRPQSFFIEEERTESGRLAPVATIFLTNRECPWRCLMCDLWKNTLADKTPPGAIPAQIDVALSTLALAGDEAGGRVPTRIKLYNSGSFFDAGAIPVEDHGAIADRVRSFERVIVECHPSLVNDRCLRFRDRLPGKLEVAMGLEAAHPDVLEKLNKRMNLDQFAAAARFLGRHGVALRVFVLVKPPFLDETGALEWARKSVDFAFDCGAGVVSLIPVRLGNGALEALARLGEFSSPELATLEKAGSYGVGLGRGRVFVDLWDLEQFSRCPACLPARLSRLRQMNATQQVPAAVHCPSCAGNEPGVEKSVEFME